MGIDTGDLSVILRLSGPVRGLLGLPGGKKLSYKVELGILGCHELILYAKMNVLET